MYLSSSRPRITCSGEHNLFLFLRGQNLLGYIDGSLPYPDPFMPSVADVPALSNLAYASWVQQDQSILSMLISSLFEEMMSLAVGHVTSHLYGKPSRRLWILTCELVR